MASRTAAWWIGDWVQYGAARYGAKYAVAARVTGYDRQTLMNMVYLAAMAAIGDPAYRSAAIAERYGARDQRGVSIHRDSLTKKGLVWSPRRGYVDFTVPLFAEYARANHPWEGFEEG